MQQRQFRGYSRSNSDSRKSSYSNSGNSYGERKSFSSKPYSKFNNRGRFGGSRSSSRRRFQGNKISHDKYIAKAQPESAAAPYVPKHKFNDFNIQEILKRNIARKNYINPTKIQDQSIPYILEGKDLIGIASTGSGKTAAFLIPMINKTLKDPNQKVLIIVPTRELAVQIREEFMQFAYSTGLLVALTIGGASIGNQIYQLRRNPQFIVGTPGRLKDLHERKALNLSTFNNIVLDEVDRMLDMGFINDIKFLISKLRQEKQSLFFSATMSREAESIANSLLNKPVKVEIESQTSSKNVEQDIIKVKSTQEKLDTLNNLLKQEEFKKVIIFSRTQRETDKLSRELYSRGFKVDSIHGGKTQFKRGDVIDKFKNDAIRILVATDVAARGLDIPDISHVINYDEPSTYEDYIHRIGRTGRVGKKGKALTFVI